MKIKYLLISIMMFTGIGIFTSCEDKLDPANIDLSESVLNFEATGGTQSFTITCNRNWTAALTDAAVKWVTFSPVSGGASGDAVKINVTVAENKDENRSAIIKFNTDDVVFAGIKIVQKGKVAAEYITVAQLVTELKKMKAGDKLEALGYVEGVVAANNAGGNFFNCVSLVDPEGKPNSGVILYKGNDWVVGDRIRINMKGVTYSPYSGLREIVGMSEVEKLSSGNTFKIPEITAEQLISDDYQGMYVKVKGVKFKGSATTTWVEGDATTNHPFADAAGKNDFFVRHTKYASWKNETVAAGIVADICGVAEKYGKDIQLFPNNAKDVAAFKDGALQFKIGTNAETVTAAAGTLDIIVTASQGVEWKVASSDASNFAVVKADGKATVTYTENKGEQRSATITFTTTAEVANKELKCIITQSAGGTVSYTKISDIVSGGNTETVYNIKGTVAAIYAKGFLVGDGTGYILYYKGSNTENAIGDIVTLSGKVSKYAGLFQFTNTSTMEKKGKDENYKQPAVVSMDAAAMDAYLTAPVVKYVSYIGTLSISSDKKYYNVNIEGAKTAIGSLSYPLNVPEALKDKKIKVTGYTIGISSSKYVNTMVVTVAEATN